jgi:heme A synthase
MRSVYRVLAFVIAAEVMIQAAAVAYGVFGITKWVDDGATLNKATMEDDSTSFSGLGGLMLHGMNGMMIIPLIALIFLIVSFFAKVPGGVKWAAFVLLAVVVQVALGLFSHEIPQLGALHGINALVLFGLAVTAGMRARREVTTQETVRDPAVA